jgi:hypothetical protein
MLCGTDPKAKAAEAMCSKQTSCPLQEVPMREANGHAARPRIVRPEATEAQIWAAFASRRIVRSLCVEPLGCGAGAYFDRPAANRLYASVCIGPLEMPYVASPQSPQRDLSLTARSSSTSQSFLGLVWPNTVYDPPPPTPDHAVT